MKDKVTKPLQRYNNYIVMALFTTFVLNEGMGGGGEVWGKTKSTGCIQCISLSKFIM